MKSIIFGQNLHNERGRPASKNPLLYLIKKPKKYLTYYFLIFINIILIKCLATVTNRLTSPASHLSSCSIW